MVADTVLRVLEAGQKLFDKWDAREDRGLVFNMQRMAYWPLIEVLIEEEKRERRKEAAALREQRRARAEEKKRLEGRLNPTARLRLILRLRREGLTLAAIGDRIGLSRERVRQLEWRAKRLNVEEHVLPNSVYLEQVAEVFADDRR